MERVDCIVAGGGVIGLAVARSLAMRGYEVLVVERNRDFGLETSGRNSEVIHAGIYYPPGSLKARLCRDGRAMLIDYLHARQLPHRLCGKLIVATTPEQRPALDAIAARARANGVDTLVGLDRADVLALEPELDCVAGLLSPGTGILDARTYMTALLADLQDHGGHLAFGTQVRSVAVSGPGYRVTTEGAEGEGYEIGCRFFINAAGLYASDVASCIEAATAWRPPVTRFAKGTYFSAGDGSPFSRLVYPVPEPGGLGVHLTIDLAGAMRFGPDVEWVDHIDYSVNDSRRAHFRQAIRRYWPGVEGRELAPIWCGIRPKLAGPGEPDADFLIAGPEDHGLGGVVQLFGIESPGLTSSLAIAEEVVSLLER